MGKQMNGMLISNMVLVLVNEVIWQMNGKVYLWGE